MRHRLACEGLDEREDTAAWATENDHQRVGLLGQVGNDIAWSSACSVVSPMRVELVKQRPSRGRVLGQSLIELLLPVPSVGIDGKVVDVCDVYDMQMSVQTLRHDDGEPKRGGTVRCRSQPRTICVEPADAACGRDSADVSSRIAVTSKSIVVHKIQTSASPPAQAVTEAISDPRALSNACPRAFCWTSRTVSKLAVLNVV